MNKRPRFSSPFRESWGRYLPAGAVFILVAILAAAGTWYAGSRDRAVERERFRVTALENLVDFADEAANRKVEAESLARSYATAIQQDRTARNEYQPRLNLLYSSIGGRSQDLARADIVLRVLAGDRAVFETSLSAETGAPVQITSVDETGQAVRAADSAEYYPVVFIEPTVLASQYIGQNAQSSPALASAIKQATLSGMPAVTGPISGFLRTGGDVGYAVLAPVYTPDTPLPESKGALASPIGFAVGYQIYETLLGQTVNEESGINIYLYDSASSSPDKPVAANLASGTDNAAARLSLQRKDGISQIKAIDQNGHAWHIAASPSRPFVVGWFFWYVLIFSILFLVLLGAYLFSSVKRTLELEGIENVLRNTNEELIVTAEALAHRAHQLTLLEEMSDMLQACDTVAGVFSAISLYMPKMFTNESGAVYILDAYKKKAQAKAVWGERAPSEKAFKSDDCVALRRGGIHRVGTDRAMECRHVGDPPPVAYACMPMLAQGAPLGLFYLLSDRGISDEAYNLAVTVSEHLALALNNIELRETLKEQSLTDPLTGLFNRRFMENLFEREIRRASRAETGIGVIMMDIDLFKAVNDKYGHAAGDMVLETLGIFLRTSVRMEDYVCRYGGDEFLIVLPGSAKKNTSKRAEDIRERAENIEYLFKGANIGPITLSGGVSFYPSDGRDKNAIIGAADAALYTAKEAGRNCVKEAETLES